MGALIRLWFVDAPCTSGMGAAAAAVAKVNFSISAFLGGGFQIRQVGGSSSPTAIRCSAARAGMATNDGTDHDPRPLRSLLRDALAFVPPTRAASALALPSTSLDSERSTEGCADAESSRMTGVAAAVIQAQIRSRLGANTLGIGYTEQDAGQSGVAAARLVSSTMNILNLPCWELLLERIGEPAMHHVLRHASIFWPLPNGSLLQLTGSQPTLAGRSRSHASMVTTQAQSARPSAEPSRDTGAHSCAPAGKRKRTRLSSWRRKRAKLLGARAALKSEDRPASPGAMRVEVEAATNPAAHAQHASAEAVGGARLAAHRPSAAMRALVDELGGRKVEGPTANKRRRPSRGGVLASSRAGRTMLEQIIRRYRRCSAHALLRRHVERDVRGEPLRAVAAIDVFGRRRPVIDWAAQPEYHALLGEAVPPTRAASWLRAVCRSVVPQPLLGSARNWRCFSRNLARQVMAKVGPTSRTQGLMNGMRTSEVFWLHMQKKHRGLRLSEARSLGPSGPGCTRQVARQHTEHQREFSRVVNWVGARLLLPLLHRVFHVRRQQPTYWPRGAWLR